MLKYNSHEMKSFHDEYDKGTCVWIHNIDKQQNKNKIHIQIYMGGTSVPQWQQLRSVFIYIKKKRKKKKEKKRDKETNRQKERKKLNIYMKFGICVHIT